MMSLIVLIFFIIGFIATFFFIIEIITDVAPIDCFKLIYNYILSIYFYGKYKIELTEDNYYKIYEWFAGYGWMKLKTFTTLKAAEDEIVIIKKKKEEEKKKRKEEEKKNKKEHKKFKKYY